MDKRKYMVTLNLTGMLFASAMAAYEVEAETVEQAQAEAIRLARHANDRGEVDWNACYIGGDVADDFEAEIESIYDPAEDEPEGLPK
jgi:hypothetical protein